MKVYIVMVKAYTVDEQNYYYDMVLVDILDVFDSQEKAIKYIEEHWPEANHCFDDLFGEHWSFGPNKDFSWKAVYEIVEKEVI